MTGRVNYIKHLQAVAALFEQDDRLSPWHISLYHALFHCWNDNKLRNPVSINRNEVMRLSKIGSVNTYTKAMKELAEWEYIIYAPSNNRWIGSTVHLYRFDNGTDNSRANGTDQGRAKASDRTTEQQTVTEERPSIKEVKNRKYFKEEKGGKDKTRFAVPELEEIKEFFSENGSYTSEAENFFNYFQSNGWLVGGKAKMKDWHAAARNWIKRSANFKPPSKTTDRLHTNNDKDYSIPL